MSHATSRTATTLLTALGLALSAGASYQSEVLSLNPSHYWQLNETAIGTAVDSAGSANGTHAGDFDPGSNPQFYGSGFGEVGVEGPDNAPGLGQNNLAFGAYDAASIDLGAGSNFANATMTVALWFQVGFGFPAGSDGGDRLWTNNQTDPNTSFQITLGAGANLVIGLNPANNNFPAAGLPSGSAVGNFQIAADQALVKDEEWHHIVASRSGNNIEDVIVVIDGVHYDPSTWSDSTDTWGTTGSNAQIATRTPGNGGASQHAMNGRIDEVAVWLGTQLTVQQSIDLYNAAINDTSFDPADLDLDGDVDDADFALFFAAFSGPGVPTGNPAADLDGDTDTDDADFGLAFAAFTGPGAAANVPEPAGLVMLGLGCLAATRRRRG